MVYANNSQLAVGERVLWYEVEAVVGADAFAVTYLARDTQTPSAEHYSGVVAVRELLPKELIERGPSAELHANSEAHAEAFIKARQQFIEEGNALANLRHPAVVKVHFQRRANATAYMVMEWVDGISLRDALAQWQALPEVALLDRIGALLDGLTIVHESGIIHGGIAPDNVWLRHDGSAVLVNFSAAQQAYQRGLHEPLIGLHAGYAAPEQYANVDPTLGAPKLGTWTDVYSIAALLYRVVTGFRPADALTRIAHLAGSLDPQRSATDLAGGCYSDALLSAIDRSLSLDPSARPQTVAALHQQLIAMAQLELLLPAQHSRTNIQTEVPLASTNVAEPVALPGRGPVAQEAREHVDSVRAKLPHATQVAPEPVVVVSVRAASVSNVRATPRLRLPYSPELLRFFFICVALLVLIGLFLRGPLFETPSVPREPQALSWVAGQALDKLLSNAEVAEASTRYVAPIGDNAVDAYLAALNIDPDNEQALLGLDRILAFLSARATRAAAQRDNVAAERFAQQALQLLRGTEAESGLGAAARLWIDAEMETFMIRFPDVRRDVVRERYITPVTHAGRYADRVERLLVEARRALAAGDNALAAYRVNTALTLRPDSKSALALSAELR